LFFNNILSNKSKFSRLAKNNFFKNFNNMSKTLYFCCRGEIYKVKENGDMLQENNHYNEWDSKWKLLGVSFHHWKKDIDLTLQDIFAHPEKMVKGIVWDVDHGTVRQWGGRYCGKLPRVKWAYVK
jgi:asparagine synthetase B (glutamine-hydrolysing)